MKFDFISIGGSIEDISLFSDQGVVLKHVKNLVDHDYLAFKFGGKALVKKVISNPGGGAANTAASFSSLGFKTAIISAIGDDIRGRMLLDNFHNQKIDTEALIIDKKNLTGFSMIIIAQDNEHVALTYRGASDSMEIKERQLNHLRGAEWAYISSLTGNWERCLKKIFSIQSLKIAWNPGSTQITAGKQILEKFLKKLDVLILNIDEAIQLVHSEDVYAGKNHAFLKNTDRLLEIIHSWGPKIVLITEGANGSKAFNGNKIFFQETLNKKHVIDTTGAGDAFGSDFVAGLKLYGNDIKKSLHLGAKNAARELAEPGAQNTLLNKKDI